jgi:peroxiredoxin
MLRAPFAQRFASAAAETHYLLPFCFQGRLCHHSYPSPRSRETAFEEMTATRPQSRLRVPFERSFLRDAYYGEAAGDAKRVPSIGRIILSLAPMRWILECVTAPLTVMGGPHAMAATASTMLELGTTAPEFLLPDVVSGKAVSTASFEGKHALLVMFICHHCPFVKHVKSELAQLGRDYAAKGVGIVGISSNDPAVSADDSPAGLQRMAAEWGFNFPVCYDENQAVAKSYAAACTPDFYLFDQDRKLVYRGQLDDSRPSNGKPVTGADLRAAIDALVAGQPVNQDQRPSVGCNIKWKPGNEPAYYSVAAKA